MRSLLQYEARLFSLSGCSEAMMEMQSILGIGIECNENVVVSRPPNLPNLSKRGWTKLCGLVCVYRLADVVAFLGGCKLNESQVPPRVKYPIKELYVRISFFSISLHIKVQFRVCRSFSIGLHLW